MRAVRRAAAVALVAALSLAIMPTAGAQEDNVMILEVDCEGEQVDITNAGKAPVDMSAWILHDEETGSAADHAEFGNHEFSFSDDVDWGFFVLEPGATVTVHRGDQPDTQTDLYWHNNHVWNNDGDVATLRDGDRDVVSEMDCDAPRREAPEPEPEPEPVEDAPEEDTSASDAPDRPDGLRGTAPECPADLRASATGEGIHLSWWHGSDDVESEFRVYRMAADENAWTRIATVPGDQHAHLDKRVEEGATYQYRVTFYDGVESGGCGELEATAIPFFTAPLLGALALAGGVGAYAALRRP